MRLEKNRLAPWNRQPATSTWYRKAASFWTVDTIRELGEPILAALAALRDKEPPEGEPELRQAVRCLVRLRDQLIARQRAGDTDGGRWLDRTNLILSGVFGAEYPVGGVPWQRIDATRDALRELMDDARAREND